MFKALGATFIATMLATSAAAAHAAVLANSPGKAVRAPTVQLAQTQIRIDGGVLERGFAGRRARYDESELEGLIIDRYLENNRSLDPNLSEDERAYALLTALKLEDRIFNIVKGRELVVHGEKILSVRGAYSEEIKQIRTQFEKTAAVFNSLNKDSRHYHRHRRQLNANLLAITRHYETVHEKYQLILSHYRAAARAPGGREQG